MTLELMVTTATITKELAKKVAAVQAVHFEESSSASKSSLTCINI